MKVNTKDNLKTCVAVDNLNDPHTHAGLSGAAEMDRADRSESGTHRSEDVAVTAQPRGPRASERERRVNSWENKVPKLAN